MPLVYDAIDAEDIALAKRLILEGNDVNEHYDGYDWDTPLHQAILVGDEELVLLLIQHGANVLDKDFNEYTPLTLAASEGREAIVSLLLENGAEPSINVQGDAGYTALHAAAANGNAAIVATLLEHGADAALTTEYGDTAMRLAERIGNKDVVDILRRCKTAA